MMKPLSIEYTNIIEDRRIKVAPCGDIELVNIDLSLWLVVYLLELIIVMRFICF